MEEPLPVHFFDLPRNAVADVFTAALQLHQSALKQLQDREEAMQLRRLDPRRTLPLVCKAFLEACSEAAGLWHRVQLNLLTLSAERVPMLAGWLAAHAPALRVLVLHGRLLASADAALRQHAGALAAAIQQAALLQQLDLGRPLAAAVAARLEPQQLPCLRAVAVDLTTKASDPAISTAGNAESLRDSPAGEAEHAVAQLLRLPTLCDLVIRSSLETRLLVRDTALRPLEALHFVDVGSRPPSPLLGPLASLTTLTSLRVSQCAGFELPGPLTALRRLAHLHAASRHPFDPVRVGARLAALPGLRALWLQHAAFEDPAMLASLPHLHTLALVGASGEYAAALQALAEATQLRALRLEAHAQAVSEVPDAAWGALAALRGGGLTRLELPHCRLRELPWGAYLHGLQVLDLGHNCLLGVPPVLAACHRLAHLGLAVQEAAGLGASKADVLVLRQLPRLRTLVSSAGHYGPSYLAIGLRSPAELAHLRGLRAALPPGVRITNQQADFDCAAGRLAALFGVDVRSQRP